MQFEELSLADCAAHIVDNRGKTCPVGDIGRPLIATNCLRDGSLYPTYETTRFVSEDTYRTWFRGHPEPGDLIFVTKGSPGRVCLAPNPVDFCIAQDMVAIRANERKVYSKYLFAVLRSDEAQRRIANMHVGTLIPHFKKGDFDKLFLPIPPRPVQEFIGDLYFDLSARIDLLQRTNTTLESIAQALFKSWFIDFDPVRAKQAGREPEGMDAATAALFPAEFEKSALGLIPKGWPTDNLAALCESIFSGGTPDTRKAEYWDGALPWFSSGETRESVVIDTEKRISQQAVENSSTKLAKPGDILIASAGQGHTRGQTSYCAMETYINQSVVSVRTDRMKGHPAWTFYNLSRRYDEMRALSDSHSIRGSLTTKLLASMRVVIPPVGLMHVFGSVAESLLAAQAENRRWSKSLASLRDTLLPRLISGKLRLPEAQEQQEDALA